MSLLEVQGLTVNYGRGRTKFSAVRDVDLKIPAGKTHGLVGESGCGKSTLGRALVAVSPVSAGRILLDGEDVTAQRTRNSPAYRRRVQMVFQDPIASLNPRLTIGATLAEVARLGLRQLSSADRDREVRRVVSIVGLSPAALGAFPYAFSGGELQRVSIARCLLVRPEFLIADEVTSSLDVSVQASVLMLLRELQAEFGLSYLFISHDLAVVRYMSDVVSVMYLGSIVESAETTRLFTSTEHPYTSALISSVPRFGRDFVPPQVLGDAPDPRRRPAGCAFHPRCIRGPLVEMEHRTCLDLSPPLVAAEGHQVACHYPESLERGET